MGNKIKDIFEQLWYLKPKSAPALVTRAAAQAQLLVHVHVSPPLTENACSRNEI